MGDPLSVIASAELEDEVRKFEKEPTNTLAKTIRTTGRRIAYLFRRSTLEKLDEDISDFRDHLSTVMQVLELKEHQNTQNDIEVVKTIVETVAPDTTIDYNTACAKRHTDTGQWFVQSPAFTTWLQQDNSFLWLYGFAGCGKSVLCSTAIEYAFCHARSQAESAMAFFFFTFNDESKQDASALLRALLLQFSGQISGLDVELTRLQETYQHGTPPVPILTEYLRQAVNRAMTAKITSCWSDVHTSRESAIDSQL
ncbi:hypothetical protein H2198_001274 [Neophaeococcomyces mojaviensis]|uniref:Uncharacterized protein n=1 Tax=Neophaeococcomyces mojaviensis TaxID=3383035 RepID=A0ACC3AHD5_9EURO|nr:hypothetical protein H2198_001274 [Knufia sp. JES_112]